MVDAYRFTGDSPDLLHQDTIMTLALRINGVHADTNPSDHQSVTGLQLKAPQSTVPLKPLLAFWPAAPLLFDSHAAAAAKVRAQATPTAQSTAAEHVDQLALKALQHQAVQHPYLRALSLGELPDLRLALRDFGRQYYAYSAHFPRYLTAVISRLENPAHRLALMDNLTEESGQYEQEELDELAAIGIAPDWIVGLPHPELFRRFRRALGVGDDDQQPEAIEVVCWREQFLAILTSGSAAEALGALGLGTETIVQTIYQPFVSAIDRIGMEPRDSVFFPLHTAVDDHHQATLRDIAIDLAATEQGRLDLAKGMEKALALRCSFWSWLHQRALQPQFLQG
jgi:pyrroloquinoline quinone (PQQ) biosynthesis protein C